MNANIKAPVVFVSHGAPTFAMEPGVLGPRLQALGAQLTALKAVLVVSAHWQTREIKVMTTERPETVHDFGGFPAKLYEMQYPAAGQPDLAKIAAQLLSVAGFTTQLDERRGLDHGAWVPLIHLLPKANVPVFQVSMPASLNSREALKLGHALAPLREQGVLIMGSGSMTHNLYDIRQATSEPVAYAKEFAGWVKTIVLTDVVNQIVNYRAEAPYAERAHPTEEHFLPLLVAFGAQNPEDDVQLIEGGFTHGVLSMDSYVWGLPAHTADQVI